MDIQATKLELVQLLLDTQSEDILEEIKRVFEKRKPTTWEKTSEAEKAAIEKGLEQIAQGRVKSHEEVMAKFRQKYLQ